MKRTQMVLRGILAAVFAMAFTACASLSEPDGTNQTLVVGGVIVRHEGSAVTRGIGIVLREFNGTRTHRLASGVGGLFYSSRIPPGTYIMTSVIYQMPQGGNMTVNITPPPKIEIESGRVNNFGAIHGTVDGMNRVASFIWNQGYEQARDLFQQRHGSSSWNEMPWVNIGFNSANTPVAAQAEPAAQPPQVAEPVPPMIHVPPPPPVEY